MKCAGAELEEEARLANFPRRPKKMGEGLRTLPLSPLSRHVSVIGGGGAIGRFNSIVSLSPLWSRWMNSANILPSLVPPIYLADLSSVSDWTRPV